jgi:hypothetical protein
VFSNGLVTVEDWESLESAEMVDLPALFEM